MDVFQISLALATFLCTLVAGFLIAFAVVVMPGIRVLGDRAFLKAFKQMDRVIQNNHPLFMVIWAGSVLTLIAASVLGFSRVEGPDFWLLLSSLIIYLIGVQLPTATINVPLNNQLQKQDLDGMSESEAREARTQFEPRWMRWNSIRTVIASIAAALLLLLVLRL